MEEFVRQHARGCATPSASGATRTAARGRRCSIPCSPSPTGAAPIAAPCGARRPVAGTSAASTPGGNGRTLDNHRILPGVGPAVFFAAIGLDDEYLAREEMCEGLERRFQCVKCFDPARALFGGPLQRT